MVLSEATTEVYERVLRTNEHEDRRRHGVDRSNNVCFGLCVYIIPVSCVCSQSIFIHCFPPFLFPISIHIYWNDIAALARPSLTMKSVYDSTLSYHLSLFILPLLPYSPITQDYSQCLPGTASSSPTTSTSKPVTTTPGTPTTRIPVKTTTLRIFKSRSYSPKWLLLDPSRGISQLPVSILKKLLLPRHSQCVIKTEIHADGETFN